MRISFTQLRNASLLAALAGVAALSFAAFSDQSGQIRATAAPERCTFRRPARRGERRLLVMSPGGVGATETIRALATSLAPANWTLNDADNRDGAKHVHPGDPWRRRAVECFAPDRVLYVFGDPGAAVRAHYRRKWVGQHLSLLAPYLGRLGGSGARHIGLRGGHARQGVGDPAAETPRTAAIRRAWNRSPRGVLSSDLGLYCAAAMQAGSELGDGPLDLLGQDAFMDAWLRLYGASLDGMPPAESANATGRGLPFRSGIDRPAPFPGAPMLLLDFPSFASGAARDRLASFLSVPADAVPLVGVKPRRSGATFRGKCTRGFGGRDADAAADVLDRMYGEMYRRMGRWNGVLLERPVQEDTAGRYPIQVLNSVDSDINALNYGLHNGRRVRCVDVRTASPG
ncbi:hypothetical protein DFJ74DRAFT_707999 [Hyaloraphidium curvatum]|nr:hypothetical protein DFJ74DRAFT_707999 [Hyaloraphidium curvatum]